MFFPWITFQCFPSSQLHTATMPLCHFRMTCCFVGISPAMLPEHEHNENQDIFFQKEAERFSKRHCETKCPTFVYFVRSRRRQARLSNVAVGFHGNCMISPPRTCRRLRSMIDLSSGNARHKTKRHKTIRNDAKRHARAMWR